MPRVGGAARVTHFGGTRELAVVCAVRDDGRRVSVDTESGERLEFVLNRATAKFASAGSAHGARLELLGP
jgi:hypothetical protein